MRSNRLLIVFLVIFIDLMGFGLILPLIPFYAEAYGASTLVAGLLVASYAAAQFIGAPILGRLSDRYGRKPVLMASIAGTAAGFLLLALAEPIGKAMGASLGLGTDAINLMVLGVLFASRILDGLTGGNISVAQAYITDVTDESDRARGLGLIGAAFGLGFIVGPAIGGSLSVFGYAAPAYLAAALATANLVSVYFLLPESLTPQRRAEIAQSARPPFSLKALANAFDRPRVGPLLHVRFWFGMAFSMFQTIFALYAAGEPLELSAQATAYVLTYVGFLAVVVQGFAVGRLAKRYSETSLMLVSAALMAASLAGWALVSTLPMLLAIMVPLSFAGGILNTVINSALTKAVYPEEVGGTLGLAASLESLTRVISPAAGAFMLSQYGPATPGLVTAAIMIWVCLFLWRRLIVRPDPPLAPRAGQDQTAGYVNP